MLKLLLVEDDDRIRDLFTRFLTASGHEVRQAGDGQEAVETIRRQSFDLVIMDVKMPRLDGVSALSQIRATAPSTKVILMTGFCVDSEVDRVIEAGAVECVRKPVTFDALTVAIGRLTAGGKPDQRRSGCGKSAA